MRGHTSSNNTRRLINIIHHLNFHQTPGAIVTMDAEKAFDRIERKYMFEKDLAFNQILFDGYSFCIKYPLPQS